MTPRRPRLALAVCCLALAACADGDPDLTVGGARAAVPAGGSSQVVVAIENTGEGDDTLVDAESEAVTAVEIHRTEIDDDGRATMTTLDEIEVPAGETLRFQPGDLHLMLVAPDATVEEGGTFELVLRFERTGEVPLDVEVVPLADIVDDAVPE